MRILGIDPGLNITGYGILEIQDGAPKIIEAGIVEGKNKGSLPDRLQDIYRGISEVIATLAPEVVSIEELYSHYARPKTAILMGHARGVLCLAAQEAHLKIYSYGATHIKKSLTGNGRAPKDQMQTAVCQVLQLTKVPEPHDVADALAIALCHYYSQQPALSFPS
ncbi:MAG: crossover junction endodeoxyribonuclease RuvC [Pirellulaceae bacterium]|nr:crossover junction endodeoxyribonuclease RuvC [Pirellulaceae bacterium]